MSLKYCLFLSEPCRFRTRRTGSSSPKLTSVRTHAVWVVMFDGEAMVPIVNRVRGIASGELGLVQAREGLGNEWCKEVSFPGTAEVFETLYCHLIL